MWGARHAARPPLEYGITLQRICPPGAGGLADWAGASIGWRVSGFGGLSARARPVAAPCRCGPAGRPSAAARPRPGPALPPARRAHGPRTAGAQLVRSPRSRRPGPARASMRGHPWPTRLTTRDPTRAFAPVKAPGCAGANAREFPWPTRSAARAPKLRRRRAPDTRNRRAPFRKTASASGSPRWSCGRPGWPARSPGPGPDTAPPRRTPYTPAPGWRYRP